MSGEGEAMPMGDQSSSSSSSSDPSTIIYILGSVACVLFSIVYYILWRRGQQNNANADFRARRTVTEVEDVDAQENATETDNISPDDDDNSNEEEIPRRRRQKITHPMIQKEHEPGDPIYNRYIIYGTLCNSLLLFIGAIIVLIVALVQRAEFDGAETDDFVSLGPSACRVLNATSYSAVTKRIDARNDVCVETWEYTVQVVNVNNNGNQDETFFFVPEPMYSDDCRSSCENCQSVLFGEDYYIGIQGPRPDGKPLPSNEEECFAPRPSVADDLSDYYNCGRQSETCYMLEDPADQLEEDQFSVQISLIITYVCFGTGFLLLLVVWFFRLRNKQEAKRGEAIRAQKQQEQEENEEIGGDEDVVVNTDEDDGGVTENEMADEAT